MEAENDQKFCSFTIEYSNYNIIPLNKIIQDESMISFQELYMEKMEIENVKVKNFFQDNIVLSFSSIDLFLNENKEFYVSNFKTEESNESQDFKFFRNENKQFLFFNKNKQFNELEYINLFLLNPNGTPVEKHLDVFSIGVKIYFQ